VTARGELVAVVLPGEYGKPRPALVLQSDLLGELGTVVVCPVTSALRDADFRVAMEPTSGNGLQKPSQVMVDKITFVRRERLGQVIGVAEPAVMRGVERALLLVAGLA
jgi:mRNA interferase MazF